MSSWKVIHLKPNTEKKFMRYCERYNITCYVPLHKTYRVCQRRRLVVELPVFTGYAFAKYSDNDRLDVLKSNCVCKVIEPYEPRQFLRELIMVRRALKVNPHLKTVPLFKEGQMVRITSGPFMGTEGYIKRISSRTKVILNVSAIGQALTIVAASDSLEVL